MGESLTRFIKSNNSLLRLVFRYLWIGLGIGAILLSYTNCGKGFEVVESLEGSGSSTGLSTVAIPWPKVNCDAQDASEPRQKAEADVEKKDKIPDSFLNQTFVGGEKLLVTVNNECHARQTPQSLFTRAATEMLLTPNAEMSTFQFILPEPISGAELVAAANKDECVVEVDLDRKTYLFSLPSDAKYSEQKYLTAIKHDAIFSQVHNAKNGINQVIKIAVIDSGVDTEHPDLKNNMYRVNGQVVALNAINNTSVVTDSGFHGTHVTGLAAAEANNSIGISGTMGLSVKIIPIRVSDDGSSISDSAVINAIRWAADQGADVINMSFGGSVRVEAWAESIQYAINKGVFIVVAAGNDSRQITTSAPTYPAMFSAEYEGMVTIGSFDASSYQRSSFSNYSTQYVDLLAPGSDGTTGIISTVPTALSSSGYGKQVSSGGSTRPINGTSMASPVAAGAAALVMGLARSRGFEITPSQVETFFEKGLGSSAAFGNFAKGGKILDLQKLLQFVASDTGLVLTSTLDRSEAAGKVAIESESESLGLRTGAALNLEIQKTAGSSILVKYQWYKNKEPIPGATSEKFTIPSVALSDKAIYQGAIISGKAKALTKEILVNVEDCPNK